MKFVICGDVCPQGSNEAYINGETKMLFGDIPEAVKGADRFLVNIECALTDKDTPIQKKGPNIKASPLCVNVLKEIGVTDCGIANNHIFDYGIPGVRDTVNAIKGAGFGITGFGENYDDARKNLVIEHGGKKITVIAVCEHEYCTAMENRMGARGFDPFDSLCDIADAKKESDFVIVTYHGGKEQCEYPSPRLVRACRAMVKMGADAVLCQHSHCIGCYEEYMGGHILYGQGNFHFTGRSDHPHWQTGLIASLDIQEKVGIEFIPFYVEGLGIKLAKGEKYDEIMSAFAKRNEELKNGEWIKGWATFCEENKEKYLGNISRAYTENANPDDNELFNGRMHCEAHKDVIDWLCKHSWEERQEP